VPGYNAAASANEVDGDPVPVPHFGAALSLQQFHELAERLDEKGVQFIIKPHLRFKGQPGEQVNNQIINSCAISSQGSSRWGCLNVQSGQCACSGGAFRQTASPASAGTLRVLTLLIADWCATCADT
jgi:hypothetical protein